MMLMIAIVIVVVIVILLVIAINLMDAGQLAAANHRVEEDLGHPEPLVGEGDLHTIYMYIYIYIEREREIDNEIIYYNITCYSIL